MKTKKYDKFVWYADHAQVGLLIFFTLKRDASYGFIYAPRMIFERLGKRCNPLYVIELNCGPMGFIPRHYYEEAGITVNVPWLVQFVIAHEIYRQKQDCSEVEKGNDKLMTDFILKAWNEWDAAKNLH